MTFFYPLAGALAVLAVPIIALYLIRTRPRARRTSTLLFWQQLPTQVYNRAFWQRLRRWISLALQLLLLALLIFALARPGLEGRQPASLVLVLDGSASMGAADAAFGTESRAEAARREAVARIAALRPFDEVLLLHAAETPRILSGWSRNRRALGRALATATQGEGPGSAAETLRLAHDLARQRKEARILFLTDGVWATPPDAALLEGVQIHRIGGTEAPRNTGLTLFSARRSLAVPGEIALLVRVVASHDTTTTLEVWRNDRLMDARPLTLKAGEPWQQTWEETENGAVTFQARLTDLSRDDLAADNHATAQLPAVRPVPVTVVSRPNAFLEAALGSLPAVEVEWRLPDAAPPDPERFCIYHETVPPDGFRPRALLLIRPPASGFWGRAGAEVPDALVSDLPGEDTAFLRFVALETVRPGTAHAFTPGEGATVYAESFGTPLLFGQWERDPRWLVMAFGLDSSDLVFRTAFPILLGNLAQTLREETLLPGPPLPGVAETLLRPAPVAAGVEPPRPRGWALAQWPPWWWALAAGVLWVALEWPLFHRRVTE